MNKALCQCGRGSEWPNAHEKARCHCGKVLEPQTPMEQNVEKALKKVFGNEFPMKNSNFWLKMASEVATLLGLNP